MSQNQEEEKAIKALENVVASKIGLAIQHLFEAGYYHGIKTEREQRLKKEEK